MRQRLSIFDAPPRSPLALSSSLLCHESLTLRSEVMNMKSYANATSRVMFPESASYVASINFIIVGLTPQKI